MTYIRQSSALTESREIERLFFGQIDRNGIPALDYFENYDHTEISYDDFHNMILFMSTQKLRTPKGLAWLGQQINMSDTNELLRTMVELQQLYGAIWTESIWQIASAANSETKFIISDHPVTAYNRKCGPRHKKWCRFPNDPPIHLHGTHTIFPLSYDKVLILTNQSWVRNPYQSALKSRPNPRYMRDKQYRCSAI